jgi:hypothetical protein
MLRHKSMMGNQAPHLPAILIAMMVRRCNMRHIAQCSMSRAIPEVSVRHHQGTTCSVLLRQLPGQQQIEQQRKNAPTFLAIPMAMAMCPYVTVHITLWGR